MSFRHLVQWESKSPVQPFLSLFFWTIDTLFFCFCHFHCQNVSFYPTCLTACRQTLSLPSSLKCKAIKALLYIVFIFKKTSYRFCLPFIYCLFKEQPVHIYPLCILVNTSGMYIMYVLNLPACVNELIWSFLPFVQCCVS